MEIDLNYNSSTPLYMQITLIIKDKILSGELPENFKLLSERRLAGRLGVHRNTVVRAYETLISEGLVISSRQTPCGYFVAPRPDTSDRAKKLPSMFSSTDKNFNYHFTSAQIRFEEMYHSSYNADKISFAALLVNKEALPMEFLKQLMQEIIDGDMTEPFWFCAPQGTERLRNDLSEMLFTRNIYVKPRNIQIVGETFEAINNIAFMYLEKGDCVILEEPADPTVVNIFLHVGARLLFVPVEEDGIQIDRLETLVRQYRPKLIYTMPNCHTPTGCTMGIEKRKRLLSCARDYNVPVLEDDSLYDFYYCEKKLPSLFSMDQNNSVIYLDTAGLSFYPGVRLAYLAAPDSVIGMYHRIVNKDQLFLNSLGQYLWARFIERGFYERHVQFLREFYRQKRDRMCGCLSRIPNLSFSVPERGLCVWVKIEKCLNDMRLTTVCERIGLLITPGSVYFPEGQKGENYLRLSFSSASDEQIEEGIQLLKKGMELSRPEAD